MTAPDAPLSPQQIAAALRGGARIAPSRVDTFPDLWFGKRAEGSRWTPRQLAKLKSELDHAKSIDSGMARAIARKLAEPEKVDGWWIELSDSTRVECPLLARTKKGPPRILIITPGGDKIWREPVHD